MLRYDENKYVARHLHTRKLGQFLTFSGRKSNCQFDSRLFLLAITYFLSVKMGHANPF